MKRGFSLLEIMVALLIASLMSITLFQLLTTTRRAVNRITNVIEVDVPFIAFYNQLEKDIVGMFAPRSSVSYYASKEPEPEKSATQGKKEQPGQQGAVPEKKKPEEKKPVQKPIANVFVCEGKNDSFFLSFITTGALVMLDKDGMPLPMPSMRRVVYLLEKDPQRPEVMRLIYRFSGNELSVDALRSSAFTPSYELVSGIKNWEIECTVIEMAEATAEKKASQEKKSTIMRTWNESEIWQKHKTLIPAYVRITGTIADRSGIEYPFDCMFRVYAYNPYKPPEENIFTKLQAFAGKALGGKNGNQKANK